MIAVGVTGAIGSGKTTVCREWEKLGAKVIYADDLAKELMVTNKPLQRELVETFGKNTYNPDGSLNRQHLIREAFEKGRVEELNDLVHPAVAKVFREICREAEQGGEKMVVKEAALLLNKGRPSGLDVVVIVKSPQSDRIKRVMKRDDVSREKVLERNSKQPDFETVMHMADYTIDNNGTLDKLKEKSRDLFKLLLEKIPPRRRSGLRS